MSIRGNWVATGSRRLQELISVNASKISLYIYGHLHSQYSSNDYNGVHIVNPGSTLNGNYAVVKLIQNEKWEVKEILLKSL